jgi:hypothetical protein
MPALLQGELTRHSLQDAIVKLVARRALPYQFVEYPEVRKLLTLCNRHVVNIWPGADAIRHATLQKILNGM